LPLAIDVALSPDREKIALAVPGNGRYQGPTLVERALNDATLGTPSDCASENNAIAQPPTSQVVAVSYSPSGVLFAQTREPSAIWRSDTGASTELAPDSPVDAGHFAFHANSGGGITCASCHPEGGEDGRTWSFICAGARRTQSMRGRISGTTPFHWDGSEADLARLVDDVFSGRMAGTLLSAEETSALEAWIDTIPPLPAAAGLDAVSVGRGKALFEDSKIGCASCHSGPLLTNNETVDVGTGRAFQVSSLRGVSWRDPFMHDGCATSLRDRFGAAACGGGDKHGATSALTTSEVDDLVTYLQSL
jgi:mono/diheme cytochrome c family protein